MVLIFFLLALLKFAQAGSLKDYADDRKFCHFALALALETRSSELYFSDEDAVHTIADSMRFWKHLGPGFQALESLLREIYIKYLERVRVEVLSRKNLGKLVENVLAIPIYVREYLPTMSEVDVFHYKPVEGLSWSLVSKSALFDPVNMQYHKNATAALNTFASIHFDYHAYARFPNICKPLSVGQLEEFIRKSFASFDYGATFPDIALCLSFLQYLKYMALLDANLDLAADFSKLLHRAVEALENMKISPVNVLDFTTPKGFLRVLIMPQATKGPNSVPICTLPSMNRSVVQISVLDVLSPMDPDYVLAVMTLLKLA